MQVLAKFVAYGRPSDAEIVALDAADAFREALVAFLQRRHEAFIDLRNDLFPSLYAALQESERLGSLIFDCEKRIKQHHVAAKNRNAMTDELDAELKRLRAERKESQPQLKTERQAWTDLMRAFGAWWREQADWQHVPSLAKRREMYAALNLPAELARYAALWMEYDLAERDIYREHADSVHRSTRAEIVEASQPKIGKTGPGIRYQYGRQPRCRPWEKLTLQFSGGLSVADCLAGKNRQLVIWPLYTNEHESRSDETVYRVRQQIGSANNPSVVEYVIKAHRPFPAGAVLQRWTLVVREGKRYVTPIVKESLVKPSGKGSFGYALRWTSTLDGVLVAEFRGEHVHEDLILPWALVERRLARKHADKACDESANALLANRGRLPETGKRQGVDALEAYCAATPQDAGAANALADYRRRLEEATRKAARAARCVEDIYSFVAYRVCRLHGEVLHDALDLTRRKKYDDRDLLARDAAASRVREILFAVAPGKLRDRIKRFGLASGEVQGETPPAARGGAKTDLFTSSIKSLGATTGAKEQQPNRRSQHATQCAMAE